MRAVFLSLALPMPALAATLTVGPDGTHATLGEAIGAARDGDAIVLPEGALAEGGLVVDKALTVRGAGVDVTALVGEGAVFQVTEGASLTLEDLAVEPASGRAFTVTGAALTLRRVRVEGGRDEVAGGAVSVEGGVLVVEDAELVDNTSPEGFGGHVYAVDSEVRLDRVGIRGGRAERGGGVYLDGGSLAAADTAWARNRARRDDDRGVGGAIGAENADVVLTRVVFEENVVLEGQGGAISTYRGSLDLEDVDFVGSDTAPSATEYFGGAIAAYDTPLTWRGGSATDLSVEHTGADGTFGYGGAVILFGAVGADFLIEDVSFVGSRATAFGGAVRIDAGQGVLRGCSFLDGEADYGAGLHVASPGPVVVEGGTFLRNRARYSAAIRLRPSSSRRAGSELVIRDSTFRENVAEAYGGVMYARGAEHVVFEDNDVAANRGSLGGGVLLWDIDRAEVVRNTFCGNVAEGGSNPDGGALATYLVGRSDEGSLSIAHNVFQENRAVAWGGALSLLQDGPARVAHNTFLANQAASGGAVASRGTEAYVTDVDFAGNLVAWTAVGGGLAGGDTAVGLRANAWWENLDEHVLAELGTVSDAAVLVEPRLVAFDADGECGDDAPWPTFDSPLRDAGPADSADLDGSAADIGASGGDEADPALWVDADADGVPVLWDCDEADARRFPGAEEVPYDGVDQDCDDEDLVDVDGDGFDGGDAGEDCDDTDAAVFPGAEEIPYDGVDQNCVDGDLADLDGDGFTGGGGPDCDDARSDVHPGAEDPAEDGLDQDCDGSDARAGCGCTGAAGAGGLFSLGVALLGVALRRRGVTRR